MSENVDTIYNYIVVSEPTNNTATTLDNTSLKFGANLLTTPVSTTLSGSGITTPLGSINYAEMFVIRDSVQAVALPIPADGLTFKVVDVVQVANQENPIGATRTNYGYNSISSSAGLTINGLTNFTSCPQTSINPSSGDDLVNLNYLQNNPPASAVIFYLNNSEIPTPPISTYKLLGVTENNLPQSSINTSISGIGTVQTIQTFANQLINLNAGSFIPAGIWDMNIFAAAATAGDTTHTNLYFAVLGLSALGAETQIGNNSALVSVDTITIEQLKMTLALPYTDLTPYVSLIIRLYGINNRSGSTDIITYYESPSTYSHVHTTFSVYVPPSLLSLNNTWTGLNNYTEYITVPDIVVNNNVNTNVIIQTSGTITLDLGGYQYKNFSLNMTQNISTLAISNGSPNGEYKIYLTSTGAYIFNKLNGHPNNLGGDTLMANGSIWILKIYCVAVGVYRISVNNFT